MSRQFPQASDSASEIDYSAPAEIYANRRGIRMPLFFKRFDSVAKALQFAVEALPAGLINVVVETEQQRFDTSSIRAVYDAPGYPLPRSGGTPTSLKDKDRADHHDHRDIH
jgi:hypothetical protein